MNKINLLQISFENCESLEVKAELVSWLHFSGVTDTFWHGYYDEGLNTHKVAQESTVYIHTDVNNEELWMDKETSPIDRIMKHSDIVSFTVKYEDETEQEFYVYWEGENDYHNPAQKVEIKGDKIVIEVSNKS